MSKSAHVTKGGSRGMMSTARLELPYLRVSQAKFQEETSRRGNLCYVNMLNSFTCLSCWV